jgi:drug/metabolite transporter (DMT)-like permease
MNWHAALVAICIVAGIAVFVRGGQHFGDFADKYDARISWGLFAVWGVLVALAAGTQP